MECLEKLCIFCHEKFNLQTITESLRQKISELIGNVFAMHNPRSICHSCRSDLYIEDRKDLLKHRRIRTQPSVDELISFNLIGPCDCGLCKKVKAKKPPPRKQKRTGRPKKLENSLICSKCYDDNCDGKNCQNSNVKDTATKLIQKNPRVAQAVTAKIIKTTNPSPKGTIRLSQGSGGGQLPITIGSSAKKPKKIEVTTEEVNEIRKDVGLSIKGTRRITRFLNSKIGKGTVESGHQTKLAQMTHILDGHFTLQEECQFLDSENKFVKKPLAHCEDLSDFVLCVIDGRGYDREAT